MLRKLAKRAGDALLVKLAYLPCDRTFSAAKIGGQRRQRFSKAGTALVEDERCPNGGDFADRIGPRLGLSPVASPGPLMVVRLPSVFSLGGRHLELA